MKPTLYTIGHGRQTMEAFLGKLRAAGVRVVCDVRTRPQSRWAPQFSRAALQAALEAAGIRYDYHGLTLGGLPPEGFLNHHGTPAYRGAIILLCERATAEATAIMCAETDAAKCHRSQIAEDAAAAGFAIVHL